LQPRPDLPGDQWGHFGGHSGSTRIRRRMQSPVEFWRTLSRHHSHRV